MTRSEYPHYKIYLTGHSLGGAMSQIIAFDQVRAKFIENPFVYTFGQPRIGDVNFVMQYEEIFFESSFRVVFNNDLIPQLPNKIPFIYYYLHASPEIFYGKLDIKNGSLCNYEECLKGPGISENTFCNQRFLCGDFFDHFSDCYLGKCL